MLNILMSAAAMVIGQRARRMTDSQLSDNECAAESDAHWNTMLPGNLPPGPLSVLIDAALGNGRLEPIRVADDPVGHVPPVAAARHAQTLGIDGRITIHYRGSEIHEIGKVLAAPPIRNARNKSATVPLTTPGGAVHYDIAEAREIRELVHEHPGIGHVGAAVDVENPRVFPGRLKSWWQLHPALDPVP